MNRCESRWLHLNDFSQVFEFSNVFSNWLPEQMHSCICTTFLQCEFQMCSQIIWVNRSEVPLLVAFEQFFSRVSIQMSSQIACRNRCIVVLVAFCWLFPVWVFKCFLKSSEWTDAKSHWLHMNDFFPELLFKCLLKSSEWTDAQSLWMHLHDFSPDWVFKCLIKLWEWTDA